ncbi:AAA family ATPase [Agathobaculum sp. Marseille-P7918]|uniref:cytidylate kinase-like family protein n=1 Tax=Agathobaculum sp. Marseille-P7918 TaxID=2479843 RepID=UPI0035663906
MDNFVVTISREYGSGGHDIGKQLAELLQIPFYDKEIVELTARKHPIDAQRLSEMEEDSKLPFSLIQAFGPLSESDEQLFILQSQTILELAQSSCVIVGRCADFVLRNHPKRFSFFLYSGMKQRVEHMKRKPGLYKASDPMQQAIRMDKRRAAYYKYYTGQEWGQPANYHLCVDTGMLGPRTAELLKTFIELKK